MIRKLFPIILLCLSISAVGQQYLVLQHQNSPRRIKYPLGSELWLRLDDERPVYKGELDWVNDTAIVFSGTMLPLRRISQLVVPGGNDVLKGLSIGAAGAIPVFLVYTGLNRLINTGERPLIDSDTWTLTGIYASISLVSWVFHFKKYRIGKKWYLKTLDTRIGVP